WQYPYFTRKNKIWTEMLEGGYGVRDDGGRIAPEDATLDFSNPDAVRWYQGKLKSLLDMGVGVIKADFGEGAPLAGVYASGRAGLSFGLSGFTFWSHDVGGFVNRAPRELYRRWLPFGALTSHTRTHGAPPREPWEYDSAFVRDFRRAVELKYRLMPYIYAQAKAAAEHGYPMLRTLFFEYPDDPT